MAWRYASRPLDWPSLFGRQAPLEVELGFGDGAFLVRSAAERPEANLVGLETHWKRCQQALDRARRAGVTNCRVLHADGRLALERLFAPRSIRSFVALFPTPWRKTRDAAERFFSRATLVLLNNRLEPDGIVRVVTDDRDYAAWVLANVPEGFVAEARDVGPGLDTYFERRWQREGIRAFTEIALKKSAHLDAAVLEDLPVRTYVVPTFDANHFAPVEEHGSTTIVFHEFVYDPLRNRALQHAIIVDEGFKQDAWITIAREPGGWRIHPVRQASTVPTPGLQRALDLVREAVERGTASSRRPGP
ncbi:MAG: hypothetical protein U0Q12_23800 [Vicinamibacterales bacterium]